MDLGFKGKTVIITGSTKGIGSGITEVFCEEGANIIADYRSNKDNSSEDFIQSLRDKFPGIQIYGIQADVSKKEECEKIFDFAMEKFGRIDVLVNNAGGTCRNALLAELTDEDWQTGLDNNVTQFFYMCREFCKRILADEKKGWIVNLLSKASMTTTTKGQACYVTNKTAEMGLTRQITCDYADKGITCNGIMPGSVMNQMFEKFTPDQIAARAQRSPIKRMGTPYEFGKLVAFLASEQNGLSHGAPVDNTGGMLLGF